MKINCDYCGKPAELVTGRVIYPHRPTLFKLRYWRCVPCGAYVGCHKKHKKPVPLGRLANAELRKWKLKAHASFDKIWKYGKFSRKEAYEWLAKLLKINLKECHIGMFDSITCRRVVKFCEELK